jgi:hypothetical protein
MPIREIATDRVAEDLAAQNKTNTNNSPKNIADIALNNLSDPSDDLYDFSLDVKATHIMSPRQVPTNDNSTCDCANTSVCSVFSCRHTCQGGCTVCSEC